MKVFRIIGLLIIGYQIFSCSKIEFKSSPNSTLYVDTIKPVDTVKPVQYDYRDVFCGSYSGMRTCISYNQGTQTGSSTNSDNLIVTKHSSNVNAINVTRDNSLISIVVDTTGKFGAYEFAGFKRYELTFTPNRVEWFTYSGGLWGGSSCTFIGSK